MLERPGGKDHQPNRLLSPEMHRGNMTRCHITVRKGVSIFLGKKNRKLMVPVAAYQIVDKFLIRKRQRAITVKSKVSA